MQIQLTNGDFTQVDDAYFELVSRHGWFLTSHGYVATNIKDIKGKYHQIYLHRFLLGNSPAGKEIDHINNDRLDNRLSNLRFATRQENIQNSKKRCGTSSRFKGVHWETRRNIWKASININGYRKWLGQYSEEKEAALAYNKEAKNLFGVFANLNKV